MNCVSWLKRFSVVLSLSLAACGGGGSGPASVTYSGATTPAAVTKSNAKALSIDAFEGGEVGSGLGAIGAVVESGSESPADGARLLELGSILDGAVQRLIQTDSSRPSAAAGVTVQETITGPAGGSMSYTINANEATGAFNGTLTFNGYRDSADGAAVSGAVSFTGSFNQASQTFTSFTVTFSSLTVTEAGKSFSAGGSITFGQAGGDKTVTISLVLRDGTGKTYWVKDYSYVLSAQGALSITGRYYDPVHGYVTISTETPLTVSSFGTRPTAGALLFSGASGSTARLTFNLSGYIVEIDQSGSGVWTAVP